MKDETEEKVFTYHINAGNEEMIVTKDTLLDGIEQMLPNDYDLECEHDEPEDDGTIMEITIRIKKVMTQTEVDNLPEFEF